MRDKKSVLGQTGKFKKAKVFVAMSGGVDSSVAALLLKNQGYEVIGIFMHCFNLDGCALKDAEDARRAAEKLKIPFYIWNFEKEYKKKVVSYMIEGYRDGITPNPDVMCNKEIKFGLFLDKALKAGADYVATGHYVRLRREILNPKSVFTKQIPRGSVQNHKYKLFQAKDKNKDQSYFLWTLTQKQLKYCLFPIGDYLKSEVREIAKKANLPTAEKKDSQGICFLGKITLEDFLEQYIPEKKGLILSTKGKKLGEHKGVYFYTIGQRHLGIANYKLGIRGRQEIKPHYVAAKDVRTNTLVVAEGGGNPALYKREIELENINFIDPDLRFKIENLKILARVRYRQPLSPARFIIQNRPPGESPTTAKSIIQFDQPQKFVAPGQSAVFYSQKGELLGGGIII